MPGNALSELFMERARAVSAVVERVQGPADIAAYVHDLCVARGATTVATPGIQGRLYLALDQVVRSEDVVFLDIGLRSMNQGFDIGVSRAKAGIAETGTLVLSILDEDERLASMLCDVHVCVLAETDLVADAHELSARLGKRMLGGPDYSAFITGPSRTADIERILALGVHGPLELHILLEGDPE